MALIAEIYAPKVAIVPIGDRFTMGAKTAAMAVKRFIKAETVIPCHFGTFPIIDQNADKFVAETGGSSAIQAVGSRNELIAAVQAYTNVRFLEICLHGTPGMIHFADDGAIRGAPHGSALVAV